MFAVGTQHRADLDVEIGIMLGHRPDAEDKMIGIDGGDLALGDPCLDDPRRIIHQDFHRTGQEVANGRCAMQHLIGEEPRCLGIVARHGHLGADIAGDLGQRLAIGVEAAQGGEPLGQRLFQDGAVDVVLAVKIIEKVGLRHPGPLGDLVDG